MTTGQRRLATVAAAVAGAVLLVLQAPGDGRWQARYLPDGSGRTPDERGVQADGGSWVCWAVWAHLTARPDTAGRPGADLQRWWPMVSASADALVAALNDTGQPAPSPDYWETPTDRVTLETVTASLVGLRAAGALSCLAGATVATAAWTAAAERLTAATAHRWAPSGYPRSLPKGGADAAAGLLAVLAPDLPGLPAAVTAAGQALELPNGGVRPGQKWPHHDGLAWTPETAMLALGSRTTDPTRSARWLRWLDAHRPRRRTPRESHRSRAPGIRGSSGQYQRAGTAQPRPTAGPGLLIFRDGFELFQVCRPGCHRGGQPPLAPLTEGGASAIGC